MEGNVETLLRENAQLRQENAELAHASSELAKRVEILGEQMVRIPERTRGKAKRRPLPDALPREEVVIDIPEEQKHCLYGAELVRSAAMPPALIEKGIASAGLLAYIVTSKFCDCLPLYRQEKQFERIGVELSRRTMADWMIATSEACAPLMKVLETRLRSGPLLQLDETTVQVMEEPGRENTTVSYMWVARGGMPEGQVILYHYAPSRGTEVAKEMIGRFEGYLQTDGYEAYDRACRDVPKVIHAGCWLMQGASSSRHRRARRRLAARKWRSPRSANSIETTGERALYKEPEEFAIARRRIVEPILAEFRTWLEQRALQVPPETLLGRRNWLFSGSPRGDAASARLFSIIETAKANGHEPYWYLRKLFEGLPTARTEAELLDLAPLHADHS